MLDGAAARWSRDSAAWTKSNMPNLLNPFPAARPDPNPTDFFVRGYFQKAVSASGPKNEVGLKLAIQ